MLNLPENKGTGAELPATCLPGSSKRQKIYPFQKKYLVYPFYGVVSVHVETCKWEGGNKSQWNPFGRPSQISSFQELEQSILYQPSHFVRLKPSLSAGFHNFEVARWETKNETASKRTKTTYRTKAGSPADLIPFVDLQSLYELARKIQSPKQTSLMELGKLAKPSRFQRWTPKSWLIMTHP